MNRPRCRRCHGSLDFFRDPEQGIHWECNNPHPSMSDEEFQRRWEQLSGDDIAKLEKQLDGL